MMRMRWSARLAALAAACVLFALLSHDTADRGTPRRAVWVFFRDKGPGAVDPARLAAAADALAPSARERRRLRGTLNGIVDASDLPLAEDYVLAAARTGARLRHRAPWLNAASFDVTPGQAAALAELTCVERIQPVRRARRCAVPTPVRMPVRMPVETPPSGEKSLDTPYDYGFNLGAMAQAGVPPLHAQGYTGAGVTVAMLDAGFKTTHRALEHIPIVATWDFVHGGEPVDGGGDEIDHGTMTLSVVAGCAPGALVGPAPGVRTILAKTEDITQEIPLEEDHWVAGLAWVESLGADIVSSSLGYSDWYVFEDMDGVTAVTTVAADLAAARGLPVVNSAGNEARTLGWITAPADGHGVLAVGAVDASGLKATFSSPGPTADGRIKPDVMALGVLNAVASPGDDVNIMFVSGTSFSCPLVSGVAALLLEKHPGLSVPQLYEALRMTASHAAIPGNLYGWGIIDAAAAATYWGPAFTFTPPPALTTDAGPYEITAVVRARLGLVPGSVRLHWRHPGGPWVDEVMAAVDDTTCTAWLPAQAEFQTIEYYLGAEGADGFAATEPGLVPARLHRIHRTIWDATDFPVTLDAPVPDASLEGICAEFDVPYAGAGVIDSLAVDIAVDHPAPEQIVVTLIAPDGREVVLRHTGGGALVGSWPATLAPADADGFFSLRGLHNAGTWRLRVADAVPLDTGVFASAALRFLVYDPTTGVDEAGRGALEVRAHPNPANPRTSIAFAMPGSGPAMLAVYDCRGRRVRTLHDGPLDAGSHSLPWDGRDDNGRGLGSGVYLYRLVAAGEAATGRVTLVR